MSVFVCKGHFWWRQTWRHLHVTMLQCWDKFSNVLVHWSIRMIRAKNYETVSKFVKVMTKILWPLFFPDTVYNYLDMSCLLKFSHINTKVTDLSLELLLTYTGRYIVPSWKLCDFKFLASLTATQYDQLLAASVVCLSVMLCLVALRIGVQG